MTEATRPAETHAGSPATSISFRGDIELLRGVAVLLVILFHLKLALFQSGFIGVDVFFVLSGFLMGAALKRPDWQGITNFLDRRARRILPASLMIFLIVYAISPFLFLPFEVEDIGFSLLGNLLLIPNVVFWLDNSYFQDFKFRPMLHYWSLGIEYQYYILFPFLIILARGTVRGFLVFLALSFGLSVAVSSIDPKSAFFLLPTRVWEFVCGYLVFRAQRDDSATWFLGRTKLAVACLIGLFVLSMAPIPVHEYPGYWAALPVALTAVVLLVNPVVDHWPLRVGKALRWLGKVSYSAYLIHYPLIAWFAYRPFRSMGELTAAEVVVIFIATLLLSWLSLRFIEAPFRSRTKMPGAQFWRRIGALYLISGMMLLAYHSVDYFADFYPAEKSRTFEAVKDAPSWRCDNWETLKSLKQMTCVLMHADGGDARLLLVGDSHMNAIKGPILEAAAAHGVHVDMTRKSCVPGSGPCRSEGILNAVREAGSTDVIIHGLWGRGVEYDVDELARLAEMAESEGINVHFIDPIPIYPAGVPRLLFNLEGPEASAPFRTSRASIESERVRYYTFRGTVEGTPHVYFYDSLSVLCPDLCEVSGFQGVYYHDDMHLSNLGASLYRPMGDLIVERALDR